MPENTASNVPNPTTVTCDLGQTSGSSIRQLARRLLDGQDTSRVGDAVLVADELVSNAHRHGQAPSVCRLTLVDDGRRLLIEVDDAAPEQPVIRTPDSTGGRGLILVDRLAKAWGVRRYRDHKTVWAELILNHTGIDG